MLDRDRFLREAKKTLEQRRFKDAKEYIFRSSSGTSGREPVVHIRPVPDLPFSGSYRRMLAASGSMGLQLLDAMRLYGGGIDADEVLAITEADLTDDLEALVGDFAPDLLKANPSFLLRVLSHVRNTETLRSVKLYHMSNEFFSAAAERSIRERIGDAATLYSFSSSEVGLIGRSCPALHRNEYHPPEGVVLEILDPDESGVGEIVVRASLSPSYGDGGYRTGDAGKLTERSCPCGAHTVLELKGRSNFDFIRLSGGVVHREEVERVLSLFPGAISDYRLYARERTEGEHPFGELRLELIPADASLSLEETRERISRELYLTPSRTLADLVRAGVFLPLSLSFVETLPEAPRGAKLRLLLE